MGDQQATKRVGRPDQKKCGSSYEDWFAREVEAGISEAHRGELASREKVSAVMSKWGVDLRRESRLTRSEGGSSLCLAQLCLLAGFLATILITVDLVEMSQAKT